MSYRIEYIDLAKGFCIILVVFTHIAEYMGLEYWAADSLKIFRMPLYFMLSGLFFKSYENFKGFLVRKVNKLLIPFLFFYITTSILFPIALQGVGLEVKNSVTGISSLWAFITPEHFTNMPIWFLLCLFIVNMIFYGFYLLSKRLSAKYSTIILMALTVTSGALGYTLSWGRVNLPMFIDSSLSAMPFFLVGYLMKQKTSFLDMKISPLVMVIMVVLSCAYCTLLCGPVTYSSNEFYETPIWSVYSCGIMGSIGIIMLARFFGRIPVISYCGRYSIMLLTTHILVVQMLLILVRKTGETGWIGAFFILVTTVLMYLIIIPFMKRYFPYVTAQKDVIKINT